MNDNLKIICIRVIARNIHIYSNSFLRNSINKEILYPGFIGEEILSNYMVYSLINSRKLNENDINFIMNFSLINELNIHQKFYDKIESFDFLNGKILNKLTISLKKQIRIKEKNVKFNLIVNKLNVYDSIWDETIEESKTFLSNCHIRKNLKFYVNQTNLVEINENLIGEDILLKLIENTSENLESIFIDFSFPSENFIQNLKEILSERKKLQKINLFFNTLNSNSIIPKICLPSVQNITKLSVTLRQTSLWNFQDGNELFKLLTNLKELKFLFNNFHHEEEKIRQINDFFRILSIYNSGCLEKIHFSFKDISKFRNNLCQFFRNSTKLKKLILEEDNPYGLKTVNIFNSLVPSARKHLKDIEWMSMNLARKESAKGMIKIFNNSFITHLRMTNIKCFPSNFHEFFAAMENIKNHLNQLSFKRCHFKVEEINRLIELVEKFTNLESFTFNDNDGLDRNSLEGIFHSLLPSARNRLKELKINQMKVIIIKLKNLCQLLENCRNLVKIEMNISFRNQNIEKYLTCLKNSKNSIVEIDWNFQINDSNKLAFIDFLNECHNIQRLSSIIFFLNSQKSEKDLEKYLKNLNYFLKKVEKNDSNDKQFSLYKSAKLFQQSFQ